MLNKLRARPMILLPLIAGLIVFVAVGAYLASPLVIRTRAIEESPFVATSPSGAAPAAAVIDRTGAPSITQPTDGAPGPAAMPEAPSSVPAPAAMSDAPAARSGSFSDRDQIHRGSGQAILGMTSDGTTVLRFEAFSVTNGPDLHVFLSRSVRPTSHDQVHDGVYVGKLRASEGAFNYELPPGTDLAGIQSVVVYCVPFRVIFTSAPLGS